MIDDHTGLEIISEQECWELLERKRVGRVVVSIANTPDIFPVNYRLDGRSIYIHTVPGTKLAAAVLGKGVAFEIDELDEQEHSGWSVVVHGVGSEVEKVEDVLHVESLGIRPWTDNPKFRYLRIAVEDISGRRITRSKSG